MQTAITDLSLRSVPHPAEGHTMLWDKAMRGFGVRIGKQSKTFVVLIGKGRRHTIGRYPLISLSDARIEARRILAEKTLGKIKPRFTAYEDARTRFLTETKLRPSTLAGYRSRLNRVDWGRSNLADISPRDVLKQIKRFDGQMEQRYAFVVLRRFFNWCVEQHLLDQAPTEKLAPPDKNDSRDRVLSPSELKAIWNACPPNSFGTIVKILMLTGCRRGEVEHMVLEGDLVTISAQHTKNGRIHTFPVPSEAQKCLSEPRKWSGWGKSKEGLDRVSTVAKWTLHDLRRTYATIHAQLGTPPHIIEALLNHKTGVISGVASVYNRYTYLTEMRDAVHNFEKHFINLLQSD
jgi:integrase